MSSRINEIEIRISYPRGWEAEYRNRDFPSVWRADFPELFNGTLDGSNVHLRNTGVGGTLTEFFEYALMYRLRKNEGVCSLTYYELAAKSA